MTTRNPQQIVFIDPRVPDASELIGAPPAGAEAFVLTPDSDGLQQIADILAAGGFGDLSSIAIIGRDNGFGGMLLGSSLLTNGDLAEHAAALAAIGAALAPGGALLLPGYDAATGPASKPFLDTISALAGGAVVEGGTSESGVPVATQGDAGLAMPAPGRAAVLGNRPHAVSYASSAGSETAAGDPTGQLWFAAEGNSASGASSGVSDNRIGHINSDGAGAAVATTTPTSDPIIGYKDVGLDTPDGIYFGLGNDLSLTSGKINSGTVLQTLQIGSQSDNDTVESFAVDPVNHIIYVALFGGDFAADGADILKVTYNPANGQMSSPYDPTANGGLGSTSVPASGRLIDTTTTGGTYQNAAQMWLSPDGSQLYYADDDNNSAAFTAATNGIYVVNTSGSNPQPALLSSQSQFPTNDSNGYITGLVVDQAKNLIYFTTDSAQPGANTSEDALWYMPITGGTATKMTMPAGVTLHFPDFNAGNFGGTLALDTNAQVLYLSDEGDGSAPAELLKLVLSADGHTLRSGNGSFFTLDTNGPFGQSYTTGLFFNSLPTLSGSTLHATTTEAVQGGSQVTLLTSSPTITDPVDGNEAGLTITVSNGKSGDELFVNGQQSGTLDSGKITVSFNTGTHTLTLSGADTIAEYETLLGEVSFQDTGTDATAGSHPTRTIDWIVNNGITLTNPATSDPNQGQTTVTIDRAPTQTTHSGGLVLEGASVGPVALNDSDLDNDVLTVTGVTGGSVGVAKAGTYGSATISSTDSYSYTANNTVAIDGAASGSHPVDTFTYTVSDGLGGSTVETLTFTIDRAPTQATHSGTVAEGGSIAATALSDSDPDGDSLTLTGVTGGTVGSPDAGTYGTVTISSNFTYVYSANNTAAIDAAASGSHPTDIFTYTVSDGHGGTTLETLTITVDRTPTMTNVPATATVGAGGTVTLAPAVTGANPDSADLSSATVAITGGGTSGDVLSASTAGTAITMSYSTATKTLTLTGPDTAADFDTVLETVTFHTTGAGGQRTIGWTVYNDAVPSVVKTETLTAYGAPNWIGASGDWDTAANWSTGVVPTALDDATIATVGVATITHNSGTADAADSLLIGATDTVAFTSGSLTVTSGLTNSGKLAFDSAGVGGGALSVGGTLVNGGTLDIGNAAIAAATTVSAAVLVNSGGIVVAGDATAGLIIAGSVIDSGSIVLQGSALLSAGGGVTVANGGTVTVSSSGGTVSGGIVVSSGGVANSGTIAGGASAIVLSSGSVTNGGAGAGGSAALITGLIGVQVVGAGAATVTNFGTIASTSGAAGVAVQFAAASDVLVLEGGGKLVGSATGGGGSLELAAAGGAGTLSGLGTSLTGFVTIPVDTGAQWTLSGSNTIGAGVTLTVFGTLTNSGTLDATAGQLIVDPLIQANHGTLINSGTITGTVTLTGGGTIDNVGGGTVTATGNAVYGSSGANTVVNAGTLAGSGATGRGVSMAAGALTNSGGGVISGVQYGAYLGGAGTVTNGGLISAGAGGTGLRMVSGSLVSNSGTIAGGSVGMFLDRATTVTNSGLIIGATGVDAAPGLVVNSGGIAGTAGSGVYMYFAGSTVTNSGTITGAGNGTGVNMHNGGIVDNAAGLISGGHYGVALGGGGTVTNAGTIAGATDAIVFGGTGANRLVLDPGYGLGGQAIGSIGGGATNTLELAVGIGTGGVSGLGTEFVNFGTVTVDGGANWRLTGANTVGNNVLLTVAGTLADQGSLLVAASGTVAGVLTVDDGGVAEFQGAVGVGATVGFGPAGTLLLDDLASAPGGVQQQDFNAPVSGLIDGDKIRIATSGLGNFTGIDRATAGVFNAGAGTTPLALTSGGVTVATLTLLGNYTGDGFAVTVPVGGFVNVGMQVNGTTDFTNDGTGDVLFENTTNGQLTFAAMSNGAFSGFGTATAVPVNAITAVAHGDVNGDGFSDVVVEKAGTSRVNVGLQNGTGTPTWVLGPQVPGYTLVGVGDVNGDGYADIIMQNASTGDIEYLDTHGSPNPNDLSINPRWVEVAETPGFSVVGVGDVNGDGFADIVVQNPNTGEIDYINMAGGVPSGDVFVQNAPGYAVKAVGDITGDGYADIIVQNTTSPDKLIAADMHGGTFQSWQFASPGLPTGYALVDTADVFGNGHADLIVQQQSTGNTYYAEEGAAGFIQWGIVTTALTSNFHAV